MQCRISHLSFTYEGSVAPVFTDLTLSFDTAWRCGLIARNGRGKTTLMRLLAGEISGNGQIDVPLTPVRFPFPVEDDTLLTLFVMQAAAPDAQDWQLIRELKLLQVEEEVLYRPFCTLSGGEQTKALLAALFAAEAVYPLIDEPTNHLDAHGRKQVAAYLRRKEGFLLVSHDRAFLDEAIDHVISLNRADTWVMQGNYTTWEARLRQQTEYETARNEHLQKDIARLEESAQRAARWAAKAEGSKFHVPESVSAIVDRGYVGAKAARVQQKATNTLRRREQAIEEKNALLHNVERVGELKLTVLRHPKETLLTIENGVVAYEGRTICEDIHFTVRRGECVALTGPNGCGKSSILRYLAGDGGALTGDIRPASGLTVSYVPQRTDWMQGSVGDFIRFSQVDETLFKAILRNMDFTREQFDRPLENMSQGQKKKLLLARSLCIPAHLYIWDEPLNYIDVFSRVQLEGLLTEAQPTMLIVEHDAVFLENIGARVIQL